MTEDDRLTHCCYDGCRGGDDDGGGDSGDCDEDGDRGKMRYGKAADSPSQLATQRWREG